MKLFNWRRIAQISVTLNARHEFVAEARLNNGRRVQVPT